jgi:hypothetical protein
MKMWTVYYRGTSNIAAERVCANSAKAAALIAASMLGLSSTAYLQAKKG